jgi:eukaryotic-like serine/threonine-protein kinase
VTEPRRFGRYRVTATLGTGAMGEVYAAVDDVLGRDVAVKTLRGPRSELAARILDERFRLEARAIAALHHPGVVQVFDIDLSADPPYLVMERVAGPSLKERLAGGPLSPDELRPLGIQIARALATAHVTGIVHRDVKPANLLAAGAGVWKLADFGVAHVPDSALTFTGQFVGSPAYAPPEALVRGESSPAGDVYGLGATLYEAAAGRWPRIEDTGGALLAPLPPLRDIAPGVPLELAAAIDRAVAIDPADRPSAAELADALAGAASLVGAPPVAPVAHRAPAKRRAIARKRWALAALLLIVVVALATRGASPAGLAGGAVGGPASAAIRAPSDEPGEDGDRRRHELRVMPPAGMDDKQIRDWNKIVEELERGHRDGARRKLREFEDRYGQTDETRALSQQLDHLGAEPPRPPEWPHGRGKKHRE